MVVGDDHNKGCTRWLVIMVLPALNNDQKNILGFSFKKKTCGIVQKSIQYEQLCS